MKLRDNEHTGLKLKRSIVGETYSFDAYTKILKQKELDMIKAAKSVQKRPLKKRNFDHQA